MKIEVSAGKRLTIPPRWALGIGLKPTEVKYNAEGYAVLEGLDPEGRPANIIYLGLPSPNLNYLGPHFLHIRLDIIHPSRVRERMDSIVASIPVDFLRTKTTWGEHEILYLTYLSANHNGSGLGGIQEVIAQELTQISVEILNDDWKTVHFAQSYPGQKCYRLVLEFIKGTRCLSPPTWRY